MQPTTDHKNGWRSKALWIAATILIVLSAGYAMISRPAAAPTTTLAQPSPVVEKLTPPPAVVAPKPQPAVAAVPVAPAANPKPQPVEAAKAEPKPEREKSTASLKNCSCETAETDLPDLCPDASCRQCKAKCGIMAH